MLWLVGLMGLLAVGAFGVIDMESNSDDETDDEVLETGSTEQDNLSIETSTISGTDQEGSDESEILQGSDENDRISGGAGDDDLNGADGDDLLDGDAGDDLLVGENGNDSLNGGAGNDRLIGSAGDDVTEGGDGDDVIHGGLGADSLNGGLGADTLFGGWDDDVVNGVVDTDPDDDQLEDVDAADYLNGGGGDDVIIAGRDDVVTSGEGVDTIVGGSWISDGHAMDIMDFDPEDDNILLIYDDGTDVPDISLSSDPEDPDTTRVVMNGIVVANILNGASIGLEDISVIPLSLAQSAGMAPG